MTFTFRLMISLIILVLSTMPAGAAGSFEFQDGEFRSDKRFPEFSPLWREGWKLRDENGDPLQYARPDMPLGGYLHAFVHNTGDRPVSIQDVRLNDVSLKEAVAPEGPGRGKDGRFASSLLFSKLPSDQLDQLRNLGEPVWWKADPFTVPPQGMAEIVVRLRRPPQAQRLTMAVETTGGKAGGQIDTKQDRPRIISVGFSSRLDSVCLYLRLSQGGPIPSKIMLDGRDVTAGAKLVADPGQTVIPVVFPLDPPLREGSFHLFAAHYPDGAVARSGLRVDRTDLIYGMWGGFSKKEEVIDGAGAAFLENLRRHNINMIMEQYGSGVRTYVRSEAGQARCKELGMTIMDHSPKSFPNQRYIFLHDEPDAKDLNTTSIPAFDQRLGTRGQWLIEVARRFREEGPEMLQVLNIDNTYRPENWYMYGQLPDVAFADPYYQEQLKSVYQMDPGRLGAYVKPTYVYAAGTIYQSACAPKPMHLILHSCSFAGQDDPFRPPTPEEKRVELYYSIAAGARGISFWWYTSGGGYNGMGSDTPSMRRLFAECALVGAELRSAEPLLSRACPAPLPVQGSRMLWVRTLLAGQDSIVIVIVNDSIACDRKGTVVRPLEKAGMQLKPPAWLQSRDVFEVSSGGMKDVDWKSTDSGLSVNLGKVEVTRMIVVTSDTELRGHLQQRYDTHFAGNIVKLVDEAKVK